MSIFGQVLPDVKLRFNHASKFAIESKPSAGIRRFGPYDIDLFPLKEINCALIFPKTELVEKDRFIDQMSYGLGSSFPGFRSLFRVPLRFDQHNLYPIDESNISTKQAALDLTTHSCDIVFVLLSNHNEDIHRTCKSALLSNGIPSQFAEIPKLRSTQRPWILSNAALAAYAKVGGTPWVVADSPSRNELIMGVSRAQDKNRDFVVGFVTLFNQLGDYLLLHSKTPVVNWEQYTTGLRDLIIDAYNEYLQFFSKPESLIIHFHKRPGYKEIEAIESALRSLNLKIPYGLVHLNEYSGFRIFDTTHPSHIPPMGFSVDLGPRRSLLLLDGREGEKRNRIGTPNVWDISLDGRSTISPDEFPRIVKQVQSFSKVNWRGFNAKSIPVTINYSKCICDIVLDVGLDTWNSSIASGKLRDKAWFL